MRAKWFWRLVHNLRRRRQPSGGVTSFGYWFPNTSPERIQFDYSEAMAHQNEVCEQLDQRRAEAAQAEAEYWRFLDDDDDSTSAAEGGGSEM